MRRKTIATIAGIAAAVLLLFGGVLAYSHSKKKDVAASQQASAQDMSAADLKAKEADKLKPEIKHDQQVVAADAKPLADSAALVARLKAQLAAARAAAAKPGPSQDVTAPADGPALAEAKDQYIAALETSNAQLTAAVQHLQKLNLDLTTTDAFKDDEIKALRQAQLQDQATIAAQKGLIRAAELKGIGYGGIAGLVAGLLLKR